MKLPASLVAVALVYLLPACAAQVYAENGELLVRHKVHLKLCPGMRGSIGSLSSIGDARVTNAHVVAGCAPNPWDRVSKSKDLAVVTDGDPGVCRNAELGEPLVYAGFPGTNTNGIPFRSYQDLKLEQDEGTLTVSSEDVPLINPRTLEVQLVKNLSRGSSTYTRGGYSGGSVISKRDGRTVGIIVASGYGGKVTWFQPIETVCEYIENGEDDE